MVFSSIIFCFLFLPIVLFLYYLAKEKYRNHILLLASLFFYAYGEPKFVFVMLFSIVVNYIIAKMVDAFQRKEKYIYTKPLLIVAVLFNIGLLFIFKYLDFSIDISNYIFHTRFEIKNIALPIGISFFTFQALSYVIDVYCKKVAVQKNILNLALYISFFPQLIAGPIVRYSSIEKQITNRTISYEKILEGFRRFFLGFIKKVLLANNLSIVAEEVFALDSKSVNPLLLWLGSICFSLQIYYDFSGYSDMAIGLGKMFGFDFDENFNYPYISKSITEFWRRWHISLGRWFRDYVYIPLGGSRTVVARQIVNIFIVWLLTGIWHGANVTFVVWGLWYFILLIIEKFIIKPEKRNNIILRILWQLVTLLSVNFGWVVFNSNSLKSAINYCISMIGMNSTTLCIDDTIIRYFREFGVFIIIGIIFSTPIANNITSYIGKFKFGENVLRLRYLIYLILFLWSVSYVILGIHNPFIYFNF